MMRVAWIGDSQTEGLAPRLGPALVRHGLDLVHVDYVRGYATADYLRGRAQGLAERVWPRADVVVVALGGNDATMDSSQDPARYRPILREMAALVAPRRLVWVGPTRTAVSDDFEQRRQTVSAIQRAMFGRRFVDAAPLTPVARLRDGLHLTPQGYDEYAARLAPRVAQVARPWWPSALAFVAGGALAGGAVYVARRM